jgi:hypothetical protein
MRNERHLLALKLWSQGKRLREIGEIIGREDGGPGAISSSRVREILISARRRFARSVGIEPRTRQLCTRAEAEAMARQPSVMKACEQADMLWRQSNTNRLNELYFITRGGEHNATTRYWRAVDYAERTW